jgi:FkbM family methyltransferase
MLGGRSRALIAREVVSWRNYRALARMARRYPRFLASVPRYFLLRGDYPVRWAVRTPAGVVAPTLHHPHDFLTLNEVFCREDYPVPPPGGVVVDIGSNIGISALWFLTRDPGVRVHCFEPVPANVARLHGNLAGQEGRYELTEAAVDAQAGPVSFGVEPSGRYGGIGADFEEQIEVDCLAIADVLDAVLEREPRIDVLKLDTEGAELRTLQAIRADQLARISAIVFEWDVRPTLSLGRFHGSYANTTMTLRARQARAR